MAWSRCPVVWCNTRAPVPAVACGFARMSALVSARRWQSAAHLCAVRREGIGGGRGCVQQACNGFAGHAVALCCHCAICSALRNTWNICKKDAVLASVCWLCSCAPVRHLWQGTKVGRLHARVQHCMIDAAPMQEQKSFSAPVPVTPAPACVPRGIGAPVLKPAKAELRMARTPPRYPKGRFSDFMPIVAGSLMRIKNSKCRMRGCGQLSSCHALFVREPQYCSQTEAAKTVTKQDCATAFATR